MPANKKAAPKSDAKLKREIKKLRSTLNDVWNVIVDIDEIHSQEQAIAAIDEACDIMAGDWPDDFNVEELDGNAGDELSPEERVKDLIAEMDQTQDLNERAIIFRKSVAIQLGIPEQQLAEQVEHATSEDYKALVYSFAGLIIGFTAKTPINFRAELDRAIGALKEFKKSQPRKHGPEASSIISDALRMRDKERKPYREIIDVLLKNYGERVPKGLTPKILADRVRSRRSRQNRQQKPSQ